MQLPKISQGYRLLFQFSEAIKFIHDYVAKSITNWGVTFAFTKKKIWNDIAKKKKKQTEKPPKTTKKLTEMKIGRISRLHISLVSRKLYHRNLLLYVFFFTDSIDKMSKRVKDYLERFPAFDLLSSRALKIDNKLNTSLFDLIEI